jgi:hypothetical protein
MHCVVPLVWKDLPFCITQVHRLAELADQADDLKTAEMAVEIGGDRISRDTSRLDQIRSDWSRLEQIGADWISAQTQRAITNKDNCESTLVQMRVQ